MTTPHAPDQPGRRRPAADGLVGRVVLVVGTAHTTARAAVMLSAAGATPLPVTVIATVPVEGPEVDEACAALRAGRYGWLVITSSAAWRALRRRPGFLDQMTAQTAPVRVAVVGPATAEAVRADDVDPLVPDEAGGAVALVGPVVAAVRATQHAPGHDGALPTTHDGAGRARQATVASARVLFAGGDLAATTLTDGLRGSGLEVDDVVVYRTVPVTDLPVEAIRAWRSGGVDDVVLTSPSAVDGLLAKFGPPTTAAATTEHPVDGRRDAGGSGGRRPRIAAIGDTTAAAAASAGLRVDVVGDASLPGLVRMLATPQPAARPVPPPLRLPAHPRLDDTPGP